MYRDHPRSCGEHQPLKTRNAASIGSSPLVRGALCQCAGLQRGTGIIPARAGSTRRSILLLRQDRDHPRSCGEHTFSRQTGSQGEGSSPLVRGAQGILEKLALDVGIIPARAGSTPTSRDPHRQSRDHPRSCGEHWSLPAVLSTAAGSSPLVRGAPLLVRDGSPQPGIIPARAGSTLCFRTAEANRRDHPRSCGEHFMVLLLT